jgi:predicted alpha-1,2-mannosidase
MHIPLKNSFLFLLFTTLFFGGAFAQKTSKIIDYVDPFIGTGGHGHTYPGAVYPFGMIQVSPDTRLEGWDGCSAYHASDDVLYGFSHTHLSGTGCSDYGDILLMPVSGAVSLEQYDYASPFQASSEKASPGFYQVSLDKFDIDVALTATQRCGFHRYTFPADAKPGVVLDLVHRDKVLDASLKVVGDNELEGSRFSTAWARDQRLFFVIRFSRPFVGCSIEDDQSDENPVYQSDEPQTGNHIRALCTFPPVEKSEIIEVKIGLSAVSIEGARNNLDAEIPGWHFDRVLEKTRKAWANELQKIEIRGGTPEQKRTFYTALYHTMISPNLYMDVDGQYRGRDLQIHQAEGFDYHTVFSLWDTYRALHPLLTILDQKRTNDFIQTFLRQYEEGGLLPVWELSANETNCMIGYHAVPVIVDAWMKGIRDYDEKMALEAMKTSAMQDHFGLKGYRKHGFIAGDEDGESVSKTLEYAYDDWCIAQMAKVMGVTEDAAIFTERAQYYKNLWDPSTRFFRAKINNQWFEPFDPFEVNFHYTEANAWQYSLYVPQDIPGLIGLMGGPDAFSNRLDELFSVESQTTGRDQADITGLIGQYAHGNEPSHHMAYLYDYVGEPWKTQKLVHQIMDELYSDQRDGYSGNEDCGQMSAWYVFSALGFYPVTPGSNIYAIGTPLFDAATIRLENGQHFTIQAKNVDDNHFYIQSCTLNGQTLELPFLKHEEIMKGGILVFEMGSEPNKDWGRQSFDERWAMSDGRWKTSDVSWWIENMGTGIDGILIELVPYISGGDASFFESTDIELQSPDPDATVYYQIASESDAAVEGPFSPYTSPLSIDKTTTIKAYARKEQGEPSRRITSTFQKIPQNREIRINTEYAPQYAAGGEIALIDFKRGGENFRTGSWQGYEGVDLDAVVDLGRVQEINQVSVGFLQDVRSWIFFPEEVRFFASKDGKTFEPIGVSIHEVSLKDETIRTLEQWVNPENPLQARYIRVVAKNIGVCPPWHPGAGKPSWIFVDEISVN